MLWHYTVRPLGERILKDGQINTHKVLVWEDKCGSTPAIQLAPVIWFTYSDKVDQSFLMSAIATGLLHHQPSAGAIWRFGIDEHHPDTYMLDEWACAHQYEASLFKWMIATAHLVGSNWEDWMVCERPILREEMLSVQQLMDGQAWEDVK